MTAFEQAIAILKNDGWERIVVIGVRPDGSVPDQTMTVSTCGLSSTLEVLGLLTEAQRKWKLNGEKQ